MKHTLSRLFSLFLCIVMLIGVLPTQAFAAENHEHSYVAGASTDSTCLSHGETVYTCSGCGDSYVTYTPATSGYTWDFSQNSVTSTNGDNTLTLTSYASNTYTEVPVADGALTATSRVAMTLSAKPTLEADQDWVFEVIAKGDGTNDIGALAVAGSYSVASATYIHLNKFGELSIGKRLTTFTDDAGTSYSKNYWYYKVSNEAYEASVLASDDFDVTEYHCYQLRHSADGVYSFWLDGEKIGDLALTENYANRTKASSAESTAARDDLNVDLKISYFGCGASSAYTNFGLLGSVKYYGLYTGHTAAADDGDCTTDILCTACEEVLEEGAENHTPNDDDGDCTTDILCSVCGKVAVAGAENHSPNDDDGDCTTAVTCSVCGTVTTEGAENHTPNDDDGDCTTDITCSVCGTVTTVGAENHIPNDDDGDCTTAVTCSVCGSVATAAESVHSWSATYTAITEGHYKTCTNTGCTQTTALEGHQSSGAATEESAETCTVCEYVITPALDHTHGTGVTTHTGTDATCKEAGAKTYYECSCGRFYEDEACTTEIVDLETWKVIPVDENAHSFGLWNEEVAATCTTDGTKGYKTCSICENNYDAEGNLLEDLTIAASHSYVAGSTTAGTCLSHGETVYTCSVCGDSYVSYAPAKSGTTWDFSGNGVISTDGKNTLSFVACADATVHTDIPIADGALTTENRVTISLSESVTLKADQDWIIEIIAKGNGEKDISSVLATGQDVKESTYIFINKLGDLSIGKRITYTGDNGTTKTNAYTYYHVSNDVWNASVLASDDFDVTEYHCYQLRHSAEGVYSFWLDGEKVGDLNLTENGYSRTNTSYVEYTGARDDLNEDLVITHIGGGLASSDYTNFGFWGSMTYLGIYTGHSPSADDGDCTTDITCSVCETVITKGAESHDPNDDDGDCTTDITCSVCGTMTTEGAESHSPNADDGDCTTDIVCSVCGTVTAEGAESHSPNDDDGDCTTDITCSVCGTVTTEGAESHNPNADDGDCTTEVTCSVCGSVATAAESEHSWSATYTSTTEGHYKTCTNDGCKQTTALEGHQSSGAATVESAETCTVCGYVITPALERGPATVIIAGSDYQKYGGGLFTSAVDTAVYAIMSQIKEDYPSADGFFFGGDYYAHTTNTVTESTDGKNQLKNEIVDVLYPDMADSTQIYIQGNHDNDVLTTNGTLATSGAHDTDDYGVYVINEKDYMWYNEDPEIIRSTASALKSYLDEKEAVGYSKPIFVLSHLPLHYSNRTSGQNDGIYAKYLYDVLDNAGADGLNIIFLYGHNHSGSYYEAYLGNAAVYLAEGDTIYIAEEGKSDSCFSDTLTFTYMNYGFTGYLSNDAADGALTMTVFEVYEDSVEVKRYDASGEHNLKSAGTSDNTPDGVSVNTTVYTNPQIITLSTPSSEHAHGTGVTAHIGTDATCIATGVKTYYECSCGDIYEDEACTKPVVGLDSWKVIPVDANAHSFGQWNEEVSATCTTDGTKGHKTCSVCENDYDADGNLLEDLTIAASHSYVAGSTFDSTCLSHGETVYTCSGCGDSYVTYTPAKSGTTWDFSGNGVISTDCKNTLSFVACADATVHTDIPVADGALTTQKRVTMSLSEGITLKADQDWIVEIIAKGDGTNDISSVLATGQNVKESTYIFINKLGDLSIGKRITYTGDNGTTKTNAYTYYHVSNDVWNASVLASDDFDVTEYHCYQLRHSADGVYSFWLDGEKVGDLTLTENGYSRTNTSYVEYTGARDDLNEDLVMTHIGGGLASTSYTNFGFLGSMTYLGVYTGHTAAADDGDCTTDILCAVCDSVAVKGAENHDPNADDGDCTTDITCSVCGTVTTEGAENHSPNADDGDCTTDVTCSVCGSVAIAAKSEHSWSATYTATAEGHYKTCTNDGCTQTTTLEGHQSSGAATEANAEICTVCEYVITPALDHTHGTGVTTHTGSAATCIAAGVKTYYECSCGRFYEDAACTTEINDVDSWKVIPVDANAHNFGQWHEEVKATCTADGTKGYKTCSVCENDYDADGNLLEDLTIKSEGHSYVAGTSITGTCLSYGETVYTCSGCGDSYVSYVPAKSGSTWDFFGNGVISTDGKNTLSFVACADATVHTDIPVVNGALTTQKRVTMSLSESITLKADQDWVIEVIAKGDGTNPIGNILSTGKGVSTATYIFINKLGDLSIGKKMTYTGDNGTVKDGVYAYYHVSNEMYNASVLASDDFDVTEYHCYQLHHSADGVYSFWVDGEKIGDLALTEDGYNRAATSPVEYTGARDDLNEDLVMTHIGGGLASNSYTNFGFLGSMKYLGVYTGHTASAADNSDCTKGIVCSVCEAELAKGAESHTPGEDDGDCTTDIICSNCTSVAVAGKANHSYEQKLVSDEMATKATCTKAATYYIHCDNCSVNHAELTQSVGEPNGHTWNDGVVTTPATETEPGIRTLTCTVNGCGETKEEEIPALGSMVQMFYDDRLAVTELGQVGEPVISDQVVTSFKVGTITPDDAVVIYESGKLIAVGTGTAKVTWGTGDDAVSYKIQVSAAPISIIMITGHSLGAGSRGVVEESIVCEIGQVYSTNEVANAFKLCVGDSSNNVTGSVDITGMGIGYSSDIRPEDIYAMTDEGDGVVGADSAVAYQWHKLTGEKVWILNSSIGSSQLNTWQYGGINYNHAVMLFKTAEAIMNNEVAAGHYTVNHMGVLNYSTANGDQTWTVERYSTAFNSMWNGFREELAVYDFDGDGEKDTVDCIGVLPTWGVCSVNDWGNLKPEPLAFYSESGKALNGKIINYFMGSIGDNGVIIASDAGRKWTTDADVRVYFVNNPIKNMYGVLQNGSYHTDPTTVRYGVNYDGIHYNQLGYNVQGIEAATTLYSYWYGTETQTSVKLLQSDGVTAVPSSVTITEGKNYVIVPAAFPLGSKITFEITGDNVITYDNGYVTATGVGTAQLIFKDLNGRTLRTISITTEKRSEEFYEEIPWYVWNFDTDTTSTVGGNTLTALYGTMTQESGKVDFDGAVVQMTTGVLLDKTNNWAVEFTLKAKTDSTGAVVQPGTLLASSSQISSAVSVFLNAEGSLYLVRYGDIGSYTKKYWNFAVAEETLEANLPDGFDMTQYHTYQLRCTDGVFSYWLDGEKIGDLTTTYSGSIVYTGEYMDHSAFTVKYLGNGTSSNSTKYGINAVVDSIRIFADGGKLSFDVGLDAAKGIDTMQVYPGDSVVLFRPDTGDYCARFLGWNTAADMSGTTYTVGQSYSVSDLIPATLYALWESVSGGTGTHQWCQNPVAGAIKIPADCQNVAVYYTSCSECGAVSAGTEWEETFTYGDVGNHNFTAEKAEQKYFKEGANCDHPDTYYKSCSVCGLSSKDTSGEATFTEGTKKHSYESETTVESTCTGHGEVQNTCSICGDSYVTYIPAKSGYTWDFAQNGAIAINGGRTLELNSYATGNTYAVLPIVDGALTTEKRLALKLNSGVTLKADQDWVIEVVAKGDGAHDIGAIAVAGSYSVGNSQTVFVYLDSNGDLSIGKKLSFTGDNGNPSSSAFAYYKVSNADYNASVLASSAFDVTQYHTYQLRHSADGVYSFWVDGTKIGDLTLTEDGIKRTGNYVEYTGVREDLDANLKILYFGCGDSSSGYTNMGLMGSVKLYGLYTGHSYSATCDESCDNDGCTHIREVEHTYEDDGDCTTAVFCSVCNDEIIAAKDSHTWSETYSHTVSGHFHTCEVCGTREAEVEHISSGAATDDTAETCTVCGYVIHAALNHTHGTDGTVHTGKAATCVATGTKTYYECSCGKAFEDANYTNEIADLEAWILIEVDEDAHSFTGKASDVLVSEATCEEPARYRVECDLCGEKHESETVAVGEKLGHSFTAEVAEDKYLKNVPDCDTAAVYYKSCAVCGNSSKGTEQEATFKTKERHNYKTAVKFDSTCVSHGESLVTCEDCGDSYVAFIPAISGTTWDFFVSENTSTNGENVLTIFKSFNDTYTELPVEDGVLKATERLTMKLSESVTLKNTNNWVVEIVAKTDGTNGIRAFLSTDFAVSSATYFYIDESGDLSIGKKYSYVSDDGINVDNKYAYYKVSNEDFAASVLATDDFDVTEYHTYQLRCTDGVYSFWLDGEKIGDLALTENTPNRKEGYAEYTGPRDDLGTLKVTYIGCGDGTNRAGLGLLGSVKYLGIYTGHSYTNACDTSCNTEGCGHTRDVEHSYTDDGDCTTAAACTTCGTVVVEAKPSHTWAEEYLYTMTQHYHICAVCGKEETKADHVSNGAATNDTAETCTVCGYVITPALSHVHGQSVTTHTGTEATCQHAGTKTYYECSCGKLYENAACTAEIADLNTWIVIEVSDHKFTAEVAETAYLKSKPNYERGAIYYKSCTYCGLSSAGQEGEAEFQYGNPGDGYFNVISKSEWDTAPGIKETEMILNNEDGDRRQILYFMEVDVTNEYASILPSYRNMNPTYGNYGKAVMSKQASWVEENWGLNVVGAMNTHSTGYSSDYYKQNSDLVNEPLGLLVINGTVYSDGSNDYLHSAANDGTNPPETCLVVNYDEKDGVTRPASIPKVELRSTKDGLTGWEEQVVPCLFGWLVKDGVNLMNGVDHETVNPRSVIGIKADGTIVMMVNDGRQQPYSYGMSYYELAEAMLSMGCIHAVNCDGGGSSVFLSQRPGEELQVNSSPSNGGERATINGILVISTAPSTGEFVRASVTTEHVYYTPGSTILFDAVGVDLAGNSAEIPADAEWQVTTGMGTIDKNGEFISNGRIGRVTAELVYNGNIVGSATINIVNPDKISFAQSTITIPNGKSAELNIVATYGIYDVKIKPSDFEIVLSDSAVGTMDGFTLHATDDLSVTSGGIVMTYVHDRSKITSAQLVLGQASEVLFDFESGADNWIGHRGAVRYMAKWDISHVNRTTGLVCNGEGALGVLADFSYSTTSGQNYFNLTYTGETITIENAQSLGFWVYVPEEVAYASIMVYFYANDDTKQTKTEVIHNDDNTVKTGWRYVSIDVSMHDSITLKSNVVFLRIYSSMIQNSSNLEPFSGLNYKATWYFDDITVDYSVAVDDREIPVFDQIVYVKDYEELDGQVIADDAPVFEVYVAEDMRKSNATGLDGSTARAYIDGNQVLCSYQNGVITVSTNVKLADGPHKLEVSICDKAGNYAKTTGSFSVLVYDGIPTVQLVPRDATLDKLLMGSQYWVDVVASNVESTQQVTLKLDLNNHSIWELEHMEVAEGFTATWYQDMTNPTENIAVIQIERTGTTDIRGEGVLVSIPIRLWEWHAEELPSYANETNTLTPADYWEIGLIFKSVLSVKVMQGTLILTDASMISFSDEDLVVDTELYINSYGRNNAAFFDCGKNSWHLHVAGEAQSKDATCTEAGYIDRVFCIGCACGSTTAHDATNGCGAILTWGTTIPATGHTYKVVGDQLMCDCGTAMEGNGVVENEGALYYLIAGKLVTGWQTMGYDMYYADPETMQLVIGERTIDGLTYTFGEDGKLTSKFNGFVEIGETVYYFENGSMTYAGLIQVGGYYYYVNSKCQVVTGRYHIGKTNGLMPQGYYDFDETGKMIIDNKTGIFTEDGTMYYYENGIKTYAGLIMIDGNYYYVNSSCKVVTGLYHIGKTNDLMPKGYYEFDETGKMIVDNKTGIYTEGGIMYYYKDGEKYYAGLIEINGYYYYVNSHFEVVTGSYKVTKTNGLVDSEVYEFGQDGKMLNPPEISDKTGIFTENGTMYYYENGVKTYAGLIEIDGYYYYVNSSCKVVTGHYHVGKTNDLMPKGYYDFDETGKMLNPPEGAIKNGIYNEDGTLYYYKGGEKYYAGLIKLNGYYYYVNAKCQVVTGYYHIGKTNDLLPKGYYDFDETGKMLNPPEGEIKNGIYNEDGTLYYYKGGEKYYAGLIKLDGYYYYVNAKCQVVTGHYHIGKTNDLIPKGYYDFDETGKMLNPPEGEIKNGIYNEDGTLYYYKGGEKYYAGLIMLDGYYYYVNAKCQVVTGHYHIGKTNDLLPMGYYDFDETGKMLNPPEGEIKNGIYNEDGTLYYYKGGAKYYAGLIKLDGYYYYVNAKCQVVTGYYHIGKTNGLLPMGYYDFDETGKMLNPPVGDNI